MAVAGLRRVGAVFGAAAVAALGLASCSNANAGGGSGTAQGVTSNSITVGAVAALSGALSEGFGDIVYGNEAYFKMINAEGGVDGRKIDLKYVLDDQGDGTTDSDDVRNLVVQDKVFAITAVGSAAFDSGSYLGQTGMPTFGYNVTGSWAGYDNLFAMNGSVQSYATIAAQLSAAAKSLGVKSVAVVGYPFVSSSKDACAAVANGLPQFGVHVGFYDPNLQYGEDPTADVQKMAAAHVDMLYTCTDGPENLKFVQTMANYGLKNAYTFWSNGYNKTLVTPNDTIVPSEQSVMGNSVFLLQHVPFEAPQYFGNTYPGMNQYISTMKKYEPNYVYDDISFWGWASAANFVAGLKAVASSGKPLTQKNLVDAVNAMKNYNADGIIGPIGEPSWLQAHTIAGPPYCAAFAIVQPDGTIKPGLVQHGNQVFNCVKGPNDATLVPTPPHVPPNS